MQRIFAFDPGTSAIGWAVLDISENDIEIVAAGVRLFALSRHRAVQRMRQRLKPEQRMRLRQRMKLRRRELYNALESCGLMSTPEHDRHWQFDDGKRLRHWLHMSLTQELPGWALVRILFNAHAHRGETQYGPDQVPVWHYVETLLLVQARWHAALQFEACREDLLRLMFRRRPAQKLPAGARSISPLAAAAHGQFKVLWHALTRKFGLPERVAMEAPLPASGKLPVNPNDRIQLAERLATIARLPTRQNLLRARLFRQQEDRQTGLATCPISGGMFSFAGAFSSRVEIDHRLPVAKNGAGGRRNLVLCLAQANRAKGSSGGAAVLDPGQKLGKAQNRAGLADADALRRSVTLALEFLQTQCVGMDTVMVSPRKVSLARTAWLDNGPAKHRSDLRHHAVDAIVTGVLAGGVSGKALPGANLAVKIELAVANIVVSTKQERSKRGQLHDSTRYGRPDAQSGFDPQSHVCARKPVSELTLPMLRRVADPALRHRAAVDEPRSADALQSNFARTKRVKIVYKANAAIAIVGSHCRPDAFVLPFDNHHLDIVQLRCGAWKAFGATRHTTSQPGWRPEWERTRAGGKLVMRLHKGDMMEITLPDGRTEIMTVIRLGATAGTVNLARNFESGIFIAGADGNGETQTFKPRAYAARRLQELDARAVTVDPTGLVSLRRSNVTSVRSRLLG